MNMYVMCLFVCVLWKLLPQLSAHRCPPFTGCTICVTGLEEKARKRVSDLCEENGGTYSGELTKDVCTHLLVGNTNSEPTHNIMSVRKSDSSVRDKINPVIFNY